MDRRARPASAKRPRHLRAAAPDRSVLRWVLGLVSVLAVVVGLGIGVDLVLFFHHSAAVGGRLVQDAERHDARVALSQKAVPLAADCSPAPAPSAQPAGLLEAPSIHLVAPVVQGTATPKLDVAVGHDPYSVWPGQPGTSVLAAHDVTWFAGIDHLRAGQRLLWRNTCGTWTFTVTRHQVVREGSPVTTNPAAPPELVLVTCYPTDALYLTDQRYLVYATLSGSAGATGQLPEATPPTSRLSVPAPAALAAQGLGLRENPAPLGTLAETGSPSVAWRESNAPLDAERSALADFFAALRSAGQHQASWWAAIAPDVPLADASPLFGASIVRYTSHLDPTLEVDGKTVEGAVLRASFDLSGNARPGDWRIVLHETNRDGTLEVTGIQLTPGG